VSCAQRETTLAQQQAKWAIEQQHRDASLELNPAEVDAMRQNTIRGLRAEHFDLSGILSQDAYEQWERRGKQILLGAREAKRQKAQRRWEEERQKAVQSARLALHKLATAQARCAEAIRSATPRQPA
jgi:hypothetical protein